MTKIFKLKPTEVLDKVYCDICGECCTDENFGTESATISAKWGYTSRKDGEQYDIDICENCFDAILKFLKEHMRGFIDQQYIAKQVIEQDKEALSKLSDS